MKKVLTVLVFGITLAILAWYGINPVLTKGSEDQHAGLLSGTVLKPTSSLPDFTLMNSHGNPINLASLKGHWSLLFFGYGTCPDICPRTLSTVAALYQTMAHEKINGPGFYFVSLDPTNDTAPKLREFLARFHPQFMGLTGNEAEMKKLATACRVYSYTEPTPNAAGQKVIDHSASLMLINPQGQLQAIFTPPYKVEEVAEDLKKLMRTY